MTINYKKIVIVTYYITFILDNKIVEYFSTLLF